MARTEYPISTETEQYIAASIENNKFATLFSGAPFLTAFLFVALNEARLSPLIVCAGMLGIACLFWTLVYSMSRLVKLHKCRAIVLSGLALGESGTVEIPRSPSWLSTMPGLLLFLGYGAILAALFLEVAFR